MSHSDDRIGSLIELSGQLATVMAREVELLGAMRASEVAELQEDKAALAAAYAGAFEEVRRNPALVREAHPQQRTALREATTVLKTATEANVRAVAAAKTVNERLLRALGEAVARARGPAEPYTAAGRTAAQKPAGGTALTYDDRI